MPRAFNAREEQDIDNRIRKQARELFARQGVLKTSVEQITQSVGIAKGSFYKFYGSKEILFFELLEDTQNKIRAPLLDADISPPIKTRQYFISLLQSLFQQICNDPLIQFMGRESELMAISRKVPADVLLAHEKDDQAFLDDLIVQWNHNQVKPPRDKVAACMTLLMLVSMKRDFLGERLFVYATEIAISNIGDCFYTPVVNSEEE